MASQENLRMLSSAILDDARRRGQEIVGKAQESAESILRQAHEAAVAKRQAVLAAAQRDAKGYKREIVSAARLEAKSLLLAKREELISRALETARDHLRASLKPEDRRAALEKLTLEAVTILGGGKLTVRSNEPDARLLTLKFLTDVERRLAATGVTADLEPGPAVDIAGGVIVQKDQGRVVCDNSFEARLERQKWTLRNEIWQFLVREETLLEDFGRTE
ncbi:MAG: V-type ATP synthase subunit E family protein [Chloroflexi bacterium]|nr:V-type ATP synthase subunit E family protein [Chloroflexota bacterium]